MLGDLSARYESNGNPNCVSNACDGLDAGGKSYGSYQFASNFDVPEDFMEWCRRNGSEFALYVVDTLCEYPLYSNGFDNAWKSFESERFLSLQHEYTKEAYYDNACKKLAKAGFNHEKHSNAMQDVIWSRAVQYGPDNIVDMFTEALAYIPGYKEDWNLSYVDDKKFDWDIINGVYHVCMTKVWNNGPLREALNERFEDERQRALYMFEKELQ